MVLVTRSFVDLDDSEINDPEKLAHIGGFGWRKQFGWDELLQSRRVLLLAEAQSGKTYECRTQRDRLWNAGEAAFYVELSSVSAQPWHQLLGPDERERLARWQETEAETATIFLDSVDELRLTQGSFHAALRNVANEIAGCMARARIVLTSRPLPVDRQRFLELFALPSAPDAANADEFARIALGEERKKKNENAIPDVRNVTLVPIGYHDIAEIARTCGVTDTEAFLEGLERSSMLEFVKRPQDVLETASAWRELDGQFGTHAQQVEIDIKNRLKPNAERNDRPLAPDKAYDGAKRLALAAALTRRLTIRHDVKADTGESSTPIEPPIILGDWGDDDARALLERALFVFASYGRVRFHNILAVQFLAAARLDDLLRKGASLRTIRRLLVARTAQGTDAIRPALREVAAWLATRQPWVFRLLLDLEPSLLLDLGDPGSLTPDQRGEALKTYISRYGHGGWRGLHVPRIQVHRIAHADLGPIVQSSFANVENAEVQELLLELIAAAKLADCAPLARGVVWAVGAGTRARVHALDALIALDDPSLADIAAQLCTNSDRWDASFVRMAAFRLFPRYMSVAELIATLTWVPETKNTGAELARLLPDHVKGLTREQLEELRSGLTPLVEEGFRFDTQMHTAKNDRSHLVPMLAAACVELISANALSVDGAYSVALTQHLSRRVGHDEAFPVDLTDAVREAPVGIRRAVFCAYVALQRRLLPAKPRVDFATELTWRWGYMFSVADRPWLAALLSPGPPTPDERAAALLVETFVLAPGDETRETYLKPLMPLVADDQELADFLKARLNPAQPSKQLRRMKRHQEARKRQSEKRNAKAYGSWVVFRRQLANGDEALFKADQVEVTAWNLHRVMERLGAHSRGSGWNRPFLEQHFGKDVTDRLRSAFIPLWRREKVPLSSELPVDERGTYYTRWSLALAAISAEAEDEGWAARLALDDAERAARYALLNGGSFPAWLDSLARSHGGVVESIIGDELSYQLQLPAGPQPWSIVLLNLVHADRSLVELFMPRLRQWLDSTHGLPRDGDDPNGAAIRLKQVLEILLKFGNEQDRAQIRALAVATLQPGANEPLLRLWLAVLFNVNAEAAVERLEAICAGVPVSQYSLAVHWIAELFGHHVNHFGIDLGRAEFTPDLIVRLARLAYHHVAIAEDISHEGVYSPDVRDNAQHARSSTILSALLNLAGPEGWAAKQAIANDPAYSHMRDRLHALAIQASAREAEGPPLSSKEVANLENALQPAPRTAADMFTLMQDRLDELADHLTSDTSPREMWHGVKLERLMRRAIADFLTQRAFGAYTVPQEGVTADEKETDIRMRATAGEQEAVIELKIGDKSYTAASLCKTITDQLVRKYLAPETRRAGCLLITRATKQSWTHPDTGQPLDFAALITLLKERAAKVMETSPALLYLDVVGLDLAPRLPPEASKHASTG